MPLRVYSKVNTYGASLSGFLRQQQSEIERALNDSENRLAISRYITRLQQASITFQDALAISREFNQQFAKHESSGFPRSLRLYFIWQPGGGDAIEKGGVTDIQLILELKQKTKSEKQEDGVIVKTTREAFKGQGAHATVKLSCQLLYEFNAGELTLHLPKITFPSSVSRVPRILPKSSEEGQYDKAIRKSNRRTLAQLGLLWRVGHHRFIDRPLLSSYRRKKDLAQGASEAIYATTTRFYPYGTLADFVRENAFKIEEAQLNNIIWSVAQALLFFHQRGEVVGDVSINNVLTGRTKEGNFYGVIIDPLVQPALASGTPVDGYGFPPELELVYQSPNDYTDNEKVSRKLSKMWEKYPAKHRKTLAAETIAAIKNSERYINKTLHLPHPSYDVYAFGAMLGFIYGQLTLYNSKWQNHHEALIRDALKMEQRITMSDFVACFEQNNDIPLKAEEARTISRKENKTCRLKNVLFILLACTFTAFLFYLVFLRGGEEPAVTDSPSLAPFKF